MFQYFRKLRKLIITTIFVVVFSFALAIMQNQIIGVSAQLHPIMFVSPPELAFGLSFPQEKRTAEFVVVGKNYDDKINYVITHDRKPLPAGYNGDGEDKNMPGYYRSLCPYLTETIEEDETDTPLHASVDSCQWVDGYLKCGPDNVDYWQVLFDVPTIKGYVDQTFVGTPVDAPGDYGCDVKVAFFEGSYCGDGTKQSPNDSGVGGPNNDGYEDCDGTDGVSEGYICTQNCVLTPINGPTCTDNDADGYKIEGGECGVVDCNDNNSDIHPNATEVCNGLDDDCDGYVDEGGVCAVCENGQTQSCNTGQPGICSAGTQTCTQKGSWGLCVQNNQPVAEICNGLDDDCDGQVDEGDVCSGPAECSPGDHRSCNTGLNGICAAGTQTCESGNTNSSPYWGDCIQNNSSTTEICNGQDDDCDGQVDEGDVCEEPGAECGNQVCESGETCSNCSSDCGVCPLIIAANGGGGGGGGGPVGLYIHTENSQGENTTSALISWFTNKPATSRVVYDTVSHSVLGSPPNYGYQWSTPTFDQNPKVTFHQVKIEGLSQGVTYYFRPISAASPEIFGNEVSYTVPAPATPSGGTSATGGEEELLAPPAPPVGGEGGEGVAPPATGGGASQPAGVGAPVTFTPAPDGQVLGEEATGAPTTTEEVAPASENEQATTTPVFGGFLPGFCCNFWCVIIIIIILLILFYLYNNRKKEKKPNQ